MKKILLALFAFFVTCGLAFAAVDINSADESALDAIKGVGPAKAKAIIDERKKNGPFKSLDDVAARVKGIGDKTVAGWKKDGSVSVSGATGAPAKADAKKDAKADTKKEAPKADEKKPDEKKADAKKADAKKEAPKADAAKKEAPKADEKKVEEKKADAKK